MTQPDEQVILIDANGQVTDKVERAVRGEALRTVDGRTESTLFEINRSAGALDLVNLPPGEVG